MVNSRKRPGTPSRRGGKRTDHKENVEVVCRLCPYKGDDPCVIPIDDEHVRFVQPASMQSRNGVPLEATYEFSYVFDDSDSQRVVFERTALDLIENLIRGKNSLLFTYGVTGSGKTYTMTGNTEEESIGILPRTLDVIFNSLINRVDKCVFKPDGRNGFNVRDEFESALARRRLELERSDIGVELANRYVERRRVSGANPDLACAVFVSYIEIYNEVCYDLLEEPLLKADGTRTLSGKDIKLGANNMFYVGNTTEVEVDSSDEALEQFYRGQERRRVGDTLLNKQSSRSHSIFNIRVVMASCLPNTCYPDADPTKIHVSQLSLVDLAGSERTKRTGNEGARLIESGKINQGLSVLRQCFEKLRDNQLRDKAVAVSYRESKITHLFKNFFEGTGKVRMIICLNPKPEDFSENQGVLNFAQLSKDIAVSEGNEIMPPSESGFPVSRRDFLKWLNELGPIHASKKTVLSFPSPPPFTVSGSADAESIARLRDYYQHSAQEYSSLHAIFERRAAEMEQHLQRALCTVDLQEVRIQQLEAERDETERLLSTLTYKMKQMRHENLNLRQRLERCESEENEKLNQEEEHRRRERLYQEQLRKKEKTLHQVREICERPLVSSTRRFKSIENIHNTVTVDGGDLISDAKTAPNEELSTPHRVALARQKWEARTANQNALAKTRTGYYNARFHRRSKSANSRVIDHQPRNRIPEGTILQPRMPKFSKTRNKLSAEELKKCSDYVLTHQEVDKEGHLTTQVVKGECIPTAGGGTAVRFNDVERLSHESPKV
uniref:Kinesin-like protein n=1 Tax=Wuchereria bancrofti TaxID=6293 RepID=A0AAF5PRW2_WUCBA